MKKVKSLLLPTLWRYLIREYTKSLFVALFGIVAILLSTRLEEVARFIALGASATSITLFILYQIPYLLQIAIPIASFVGALAVFLRMSHARELTALRCGGLSISMILTPILTLSLTFSLLMMWGLFDLSATSHLAAKKLEFDVREEEPLALLQSSHFMQDHSAALELSGSLKTGEKAKDLLICFLPDAQERLTLFLSKEAVSEKGLLTGTTTSIISSKENEGPTPSYDLFIENAEKKKTPTDHIHELAQKHTWKIAPDHVPLSVVLAMQKKLKQDVMQEHFTGHRSKKDEKLLSRFIVEPFRRGTLSLAVFTLAIAGALSGIQLRGGRRLFKVFIPAALFGLFLSFYLAGKNLDEIAPLAILLYIIPHPLILFFCKRLENRIEQGREL